MFQLLFLLIQTTFAAQMTSDEHKVWAAFFNETARFESAQKINNDSPEKLNEDLKKFVASYEQIRPLLEAKSDHLQRRANKAIEAAKNKLATPGAFPEVKSPQIIAALKGIPSSPVQPLPARMGSVPLDRQFYCLKALMQNGGSIPSKVDGAQVIRSENPEALILRTGYQGQPALFIYTVDGVSVLPESEAKAHGCYEKFGGKHYLTIDMKKGEGRNEQTLVFSNTYAFEGMKPTRRKVEYTQTTGCKINPTVPGDNFNQLNDVADQMAMDMAEAYVKTLPDLPRQWVENQNGKKNTRPNENNLLTALKHCQSTNVRREKMGEAINKILSATGRPTEVAPPMEPNLNDQDRLPAQ